MFIPRTTVPISLATWFLTSKLSRIKEALIGLNSGILGDLMFLATQTMVFISEKLRLFCLWNFNRVLRAFARSKWIKMCFADYCTVKKVWGTSSFSFTSRHPILERLAKLERLSKLSNLQKRGFQGTFGLKLWNLTINRPKIDSNR